MTNAVCPLFEAVGREGMRREDLVVPRQPSLSAWTVPSLVTGGSGQRGRSQPRTVPLRCPRTARPHTPHGVPSAVLVPETSRKESRSVVSVLLPPRKASSGSGGIHAPDVGPVGLISRPIWCYGCFRPEGLLERRLWGACVCNVDLDLRARLHGLGSPGSSLC